MIFKPVFFPHVIKQGLGQGAFGGGGAQESISLHIVQYDQRRGFICENISASEFTPGVLFSRMGIFAMFVGKEVIVFTFSLDEDKN